MIKVTIKLNSKTGVEQFKMIGHADSGPYGQDIVCAAASVLAINTINSVEQIVGVKPETSEDSENGGLLTAKFSSDHSRDQLLQMQAILRSFVIGMNDVANNYSQFIKVNIQE
ncbi:ribosomal-processing cysteine protease Prp [Pediococcus damnosus]|uniref:Ribosomal processing cysteine protease Prp n=2 Tax=Pediococcus damnosus TaxID=51663 RepID=A0AAC9FIB5_9LACO|nr:ribosomal-processing cysteine protease Prp [Pediococcus damnosus]AMV61404.1 putative ribosomal protein [Pediococcus damnosus]AMV62238.1 putative ribosomal protein [Pediococcus damnosus]AMV65766.1 putative ribosomal protein [Pediococcus damnosus]AMV70103.1 putative ribosomal protein [Pediococcus damnosus]KJU73714.1 hypothetical protein AH70_11145 [Pediococcus damnosus LMG 28219]